MTSNHSQPKHFSTTDFLCSDVACNVSMAENAFEGDVACNVSTGDSPRFAMIPQYTEPQRTKPSLSRTYSLADDLQWIPDASRKWSPLGILVRQRHLVIDYAECRAFSAQAGICRRRKPELSPGSVSMSLRKGNLPSQPSSGFHYLCKSFLPQPFTKPEIGVRRPIGYLMLEVCSQGGRLAAGRKL